jgi:hypothetical protein
LLQVVPVVVDPFVQQIPNAQVTHGRVIAASLEVSIVDPANQRDARLTEVRELAEQKSHVSLAVVPGFGDLDLVPGSELGILAGEDDPDPAAASLLGLDQVPDHFLDAPSAGAGCQLNTAVGTAPISARNIANDAQARPRHRG